MNKKVAKRKELIDKISGSVKIIYMYFLIT